jgi:hypothetical protein
MNSPTTHAVLCVCVCARAQYPVLAARLPPPAPPGSRMCASNGACAAAGMLGQCCPTPEGAMLACCDDAANGQGRMQVHVFHNA